MIQLYRIPSDSDTSAMGLFRDYVCNITNQTRHAILIDDIIDTGGTIAAASRILKERGAKTVSVVATHGIFSDGSVETLKDAPIDEIVVTDTLAQNGNSEALGNVEVLSVSGIIANALTSIFADDSVSALFMGENVL